MSTSATLPITKAATITNFTALGTTPQKVQDFHEANPSAATGNLGSVVRRVRVTNLHATNHVSFMVSGVTSTAPTVNGSTFTCGAAGALGAADGIRVGPGQSEYVNLMATACSLWAVASAASTPCQVVAFDEANQ